jgi:hypothetical protein
MRFAACLLACVVLVACQSVLGIKELPVAAADAGANHAVGATHAEAAGDDAAVQAPDASVRAGSDHAPASAGTGGRASGGAAGSASAGRAGAADGGKNAADSAGASAAAGSPASARTIHGSVIDSSRHPLPGVDVGIGSNATTTDAAGYFTLDGVSARYDITLSYGRGTKKYAWRYEDLSRPDPTLQVYAGLGGGSAQLTFHSPSIKFGVETNWTEVAIAVTNQDGTLSFLQDDVDDVSRFDWVGPSTTTGIVHAVRLTRPQPGDNPNAYLAHEQHTVSFANGVPVDLTLALGDAMPAPLPTGTVSGTVTGPAANGCDVSVDILWNDGTLMAVSYDPNAPAHFSYGMPMIADTRFVVSAYQGTLDGGKIGFSVVHGAPVALGAPEIALAVPNVIATILPAESATIDAATSFSWNANKLVLLVVELPDTTFYVLTTKSQAQLPAAPASLVSLPAASMGNWYVETNQPFATTDTATGSEGFLAPVNELDWAPTRVASVYTQSEYRPFQTAP